MSKVQLLQMNPEELGAWLTGLGEPSFRAGQLFSWLHKGVRLEQMSSLPLALREKLTDLAIDKPAQILEKQISKIDGTIKYLFSMQDGHCVEGVVMHYRYGVTLCMSTQVGCLMGCAFCASTLDGKARDLSAAEMMGMVLLVNQELENETTHNVNPLTTMMRWCAFCA
jgi:23S rRNA (adenine2503-C2)-methyltransferase